jgi:hypothetical protein
MFPPKRTLFGWVVILVAVLTVTPGVGAPIASCEEPEEGLGSHHALIIGINRYDRLPDLSEPVRDAEAIAELLVTRYRFPRPKVTLMTDDSAGKPTLVNLLAAVERYVSLLGPGDNLLVFYSGHSAEDEDGETYWIPADASGTARLTWLKHSDLVASYFGRESFQAKNLCILSDSPFAAHLLVSRPVSLSPFDLRYPEKISERAGQRSREVIALGGPHRPATAETQGFGLFAYHLFRALCTNDMKVADFENLVFEEEAPFAVGRIAGVRMVRGRLRTPMDDNGQYVIARRVPAAFAFSPFRQRRSPHWAGTVAGGVRGGIPARFVEDERSPLLELAFPHSQMPLPASLSESDSGGGRTFPFPVRTSPPPGG